MNAPALLEIDGAIATVTLARPEARNALSLDLIERLIAIFAGLALNEDVRVVLLRAQGPAFCAGHDLKEMTVHRADADAGHAFFERTFTHCSELMTRMVALPQPVIAAVEGVATAAGCQLVASCDLAIAGAGARFATPGVNIGLFCSTPAVALSRAIPAKYAMEMLLTGDFIDAETASRIGLVNRVVAAGEAEGAARALAGRIAAKSPAALRYGKRTFNAQQTLPLGAAYSLASKIMTENMLAPDAIEGIGAFMQKRPPSWS